MDSSWPILCGAEIHSSLPIGFSSNSKKEAPIGVPGTSKRRVPTLTGEGINTHISRFERHSAHHLNLIAHDTLYIFKDEFGNIENWKNFPFFCPNNFWCWSSSDSIFLPPLLTRQQEPVQSKLLGGTISEYLIVKLQSHVQTSVLGLGVDFVLRLSQQQEQEPSPKPIRRGSARRLIFDT